MSTSFQQTATKRFSSEEEIKAATIKYLTRLQAHLDICKDPDCCIREVNRS